MHADGRRSELVLITGSPWLLGGSPKSPLTDAPSIMPSPLCTFHEVSSYLTWCIGPVTGVKEKGGKNLVPSTT